MTKDSIFATHPILKRVLILPPLIIGILAFIYAASIKQKPLQAPLIEQPLKVKFISAPSAAVTPFAKGYGNIFPEKTWEAIAEVSGRITHLHPNLQKGHRIGSGETLFIIDDSDYQLTLAQIEAQLKANIIKDKATQASLNIAQKELSILRDDYQRKKALLAKGAIAVTTVDLAEKAMLSGEAQRQSLENTLNINRAEVEVLKAQQQSALLNIDRTRVKAPFEIRITDVQANLNQFINKGQTLLRGDGTDSAEAEAQFPLGSLKPLLQEPNNSQGILGLVAQVSLETATHSVKWPAKVDRVSSLIDSQTQSMGVVVSINNLNQLSEPGNRPQLFRNTFVEVTLFAKAIAPKVVVPLNAVHDNKVYSIDAEQRLITKPVSILFEQEGYAIIQTGLMPQDPVITSDLAAPVEGMLLAPHEDNKTAQSILNTLSAQRY